MVQKQEIIISYFRQGMSQREISRRMKINRKTVKKYIVEYNEEIKASHKDNGVVSAPKYDSTNRIRRKLLPGIIKQIDTYLEDNKIKRSRGFRKQCMLKIDIHEALVEQGYDISYGTVCQYIRGRKASQQEVYIRSHATPGSVSEFDWGEVKLEIGGKIKRIMLAVFTLGYSNHRWAMLFYRQDMSSFLEAHVRYLDHISGVPLKIVYDNMRTAVAKYAIRNDDKQATEALLQLSSYYQFGIRFCNARRGNEKGRVERSVEYIRRKAFSKTHTFHSLAQAQIHLDKTLQKLNSKKLSKSAHNTSINSLLSEEQQHMGLLSTCQSI